MSPTSHAGDDLSIVLSPERVEARPAAEVVDLTSGASFPQALWPPPLTPQCTAAPVAAEEPKSSGAKSKKAAPKKSKKEEKEFVPDEESFSDDKFSDGSLEEDSFVPEKKPKASAKKVCVGRSSFSLSSIGDSSGGAQEKDRVGPEEEACRQEKGCR